MPNNDSLTLLRLGKDPIRGVARRTDQNQPADRQGVTDATYTSTDKPPSPPERFHDDEEYRFPSTVTLMSMTDTRSYITYANAAFLEVSGYRREEMLGQPHNIVRHQDMPREAFADLWATLKAEDTWTALVKNRRVDGKYYWVRANVTPVSRDGRIVGYMSVRTRPSDDDIRHAEALYRRFAEGKARHLTFYKGLIIRKGVAGWRNIGQLMPVKWRIRGALTLLSAVGLGAIAVVQIMTEAPMLLASSVAAFFVAACIMASWWLESTIATPLAQIRRQAGKIAAGQCDFGPDLNRVDDIGMLQRAMTQAGLNLRSLVDDVSAQIVGLQEVSRNIASGNQDLSTRTEQTRANLHDTSAAAHQMRTAVRQAADNAQAAHDLANSAYHSAEKGARLVERVQSAVRDLDRSSNQIAEVNNLIDSIAFQTNILAINAAVEAARAGEVGKGFAVVAGEVRNLAQRSANAAKDIKALVHNSTTVTREAMKLADESGAAMRALVKEVERVSTLISEISSSAAEQSTGVAHVSEAVEQLSWMTEQNAALVKSSINVVEDLLEKSRLLSEAVGVYQEASIAGSGKT